jgi:hypothetical protein
MLALYKGRLSTYDFLPLWLCLSESYEVGLAQQYLTLSPFFSVLIKPNVATRSLTSKLKNSVYKHAVIDKQCYNNVQSCLLGCTAV